MPKTDLESVKDTLSNRTDSYRLFSRLFLKPLEEKDIEGLDSMKLDELANELDGTGLLKEGFNDMGRGLHRRHTGTKRLLSTDFTMCFDGISALDEERAVPYASIFIGERTGKNAKLFQGPRKADKAVYDAEGIKVDPSLHLPDDHLSFELSFMADLSQRAAEALGSRDVDEALRLLDVSDDFRTNHILAWYPLFFELATKIVETRFYRGVLRATYGFLEFDGETIDELREALTQQQS